MPPAHCPHSPQRIEEKGTTVPSNQKQLSRSLLKKYLRLKTDRGFRHLDAKNKLEILAVKFGLKPAFLGLAEARTNFEHAAILLNLKYQLTNTPPPYFSRKPRVRESFLSAFVRIMMGEVVWIYSDVQVKSRISASLAGRLNEGHVLGYPQCCIRWHEKKRVLQVESVFQDIESYISRNPLALMNAQRGGGEEEMYEALLCDPRGQGYHDNQDRVSAERSQHIERTYKRYPFVPHWACSSCLEGKNEETERLNRQYQELAMNVSPGLAREIIRSLSNMTGPI